MEDTLARDLDLFCSLTLYRGVFDWVIDDKTCGIRGVSAEQHLHLQERGSDMIINDIGMMRWNFSLTTITSALLRSAPDQDVTIFAWRLITYLGRQVV